MRLTLKGETKKIEFLLAPEEIEVQNGPRTFSLDTLTQAVEQPSGNEGIPTRYSWSGLLVGKARTRKRPGKDAILDRERWEDPYDLDARLIKWARNGRKLTLNATDTRIGGKVFVSSYRSSVVGGHGDIRYSIELVEWRDLKVHRKGKGGGDDGGDGDKRDGAGGDGKKGANTTEGKGGDRKTYTVKSGDTLSTIAKKFLGSVTRWREIYEIERNRKTIGKNPDALEPGMVLVIPEK